jgi:hypothetical protein
MTATQTHDPIRVSDCNDKRALCYDRRSKSAWAFWLVIAPILGWLAIQALSDHERIIRQEERLVSTCQSITEIRQDMREIKAMLLEMRVEKGRSSE